MLNRNCLSNWHIELKHSHQEKELDSTEPLYLPKRRRALATELVQETAWTKTQDSRPFSQLGERCSPISTMNIKPISKSKDATPATNMLMPVWTKWKRATEVATTVFPNTIIKMSTA